MPKMRMGRIFIEKIISAIKIGHPQDRWPINGIIRLYGLLRISFADLWQEVVIEEGVDAIVKYDPLGPNNLIGAFVQFVNHNAYKVRVIWTPVITFSGSDKKEGYGEPFIMNKGESYQATIWRAGTCGNRKLENLRVEMNVEKATE